MTKSELIKHLKEFADDANTGHVSIYMSGDDNRLYQSEGAFNTFTQPGNTDGLIATFQNREDLYFVNFVYLNIDVILQALEESE